QNPAPRERDVIRRYNEHDYLGYERANEAAFLRLALLGLRDGGFYAVERRLFAAGRRRLLDIGCATGALLAALRERGWEVCGVEVSAAQAAYARSERGLAVHTGSLEEAAFASGAFDVVLASHVIEHVADPLAFVWEVSQVLSGGGYFFVTTPNIAGFQARLFGSRWRSAIFDHLYLFSKKTLRVLLEICGFHLEAWATWGGLAAGSAPPVLKKCCDAAVKAAGWGDVMLARACYAAREITM
ncbi:MAG: class I SAM-dependent methyltransferase, partial [Spirochaetaceae bacterium]|nr:class I SAM-dependent methyltransferase [Spirochaetaceae bacterium]